jgi:hypothetical protein
MACRIESARISARNQLPGRIVKALAFVDDACAAESRD